MNDEVVAENAFFDLPENQYEDIPDDHDLDPEDDFSNLSLQLKSWQQEKSFEVFNRVIFAYFVNARSFRSTYFKHIWDGIKELPSLPRPNHSDILLSFYSILDLIEESAHPELEEPEYTPSLSFFDDVHRVVDQVLGDQEPVIKHKIWLNQIWMDASPEDKAREFLRSSPDAFDKITTLFPHNFPSLNVHALVSEHLEEDPIRMIRYFLSMAIIRRVSNDLDGAMMDLDMALALSYPAEHSAGLRARRKDMAMIELKITVSRIYRERIKIFLARDQIDEATSECMEQYRIEKLLPQWLTNEFGDYTEFVALASDHQHMIPDFMSIPDLVFYPLFLDSVVNYIRIRVAREQDAAAGLDLLNHTIDKVKASLIKVRSGGSRTFNFRANGERQLFDLFKTRQEFKISLSNHDPWVSYNSKKETLQAIMENQLEGTVEDEVVRLKVELLGQAHDFLFNPELTPEGFQVLQDDLSPQEEVSFHLALEDPMWQKSGKLIYTNLAKLAFNRGDLALFLKHVFHATYMDLCHGGDGISKETENLTKMIMNKLFQEANDSPEFVLLEQEYLSLEWLVSSGFEMEESQSVVQSLKRQAREKVLADFERHFKTVDMILGSSVIHQRLEAIRTELGDQFAFFDTLQAPVAACSSRAIRAIGKSCQDNSEDTDELLDEEKEQALKILGSLDKEQQLKHMNFLNQLHSLAEDGQNHEKLKAVKDAVLDLDPDWVKGLDPQIQGMTRALTNHNQKDLNRYLKMKGVAAKIRTSAEAAGMIFTVFLVGKHLINGSLEDLGFDALNLYIMPKLGEKLGAKVAQMGEKYDSMALKASAPILGRALGNFAAFLGLYQSIKARSRATNDLDKVKADVSIATNAIFITADVPAVATELASSFGVEVGLVGEFAGPVGLAISVAAIVASQIADAALEVEKVDETIALTKAEKNSLFWKFFFGGHMPEYLKRDIEAERFYSGFVNHILQTYGHDYEHVIMSMPEVVKSYAKVRLGGINVFFQEVCSDRSVLMDTVVAPNKKVVIPFNMDGTSRSRNDLSRLLPATVQGLDLICGPVGDGNVHELLVNRTIVEPHPPQKCSYETTEVLMENVTKKLSIGEEPIQCQGAMMYRNPRAGAHSNSLYYLDTETAVIWQTQANATMVFKGNSINLGSGTDPSKGNVNRYLFANKLDSCNIQVPGKALIFTPDSHFQCQMANKDNIVLFNGEGDFHDNEQVAGVVGGTTKETFFIKHAKHVDGNGGDDEIMLADGHSAVVQANVGDKVQGKEGLVLLPFSVNELSNIWYKNGHYFIASSWWSPIKTPEGITVTSSTRYRPLGKVQVQQELKLLTKDGFFLTPVQSKKNGKVTHLHLVKQVSGSVDILSEVETLKRLTNPKFDLAKQLMSQNAHITIASGGNLLFHGDDSHHEFYWSGSPRVTDKCMFLIEPTDRERTYFIESPRGIVNLEQFPLDTEWTFVMSQSTNLLEVTAHQTRIKMMNLNRVTLQVARDHYFDLSLDEDLNVHSGISFKVRMDALNHSFQGFDGISITRNLCTHSFKANGNAALDAFHLLDNGINCINFSHSKDVVMFKQNDDLLLLATGNTVKVKGYASSEIRLSLALQDKVLPPDQVQRIVDGSKGFRFLHISPDISYKLYLNQPLDRNEINIIDIKGLSLAESQLKIDNQDLILTGGTTKALIKNWVSNPSARKVVINFKDDKKLVSCTVGCPKEALIWELESKKLKSQGEERKKRSVTDVTETLVSHHKSEFKNEQPELAGSTPHQGLNWSSFPLGLANDTLLLANYGLGLLNKQFKKLSNMVMAQEPHQELFERVQNALEKGHARYGY